MEYKRLDFTDYFIICSRDWRGTKKFKERIKYNHVEYTHKLFGLIPIKVSADWECHYDKERNTIQINFEQTHGDSDWMVNLLFPAKIYDEFTYKDEKGKTKQIQLKASKGWTQMYFAMKGAVKEAVRNLLNEHPDAFVEVVGWSLGSSQAQLCCQDLNFNFGVKPYLYTFGSVKPWRGGKKIKKYLATTYTAAYNFMHKSDIVTYMPPFFGYFATRPVKLGKFKFFGLFRPQRWHTEYGEAYLYENIK